MTIQTSIEHRTYPEEPFDYLLALKTAMQAEPDPVKRAKVEAGLLTKWLAEEPIPFFAQLRRRAPVFATPFITLVTRYNDVLEVLDANDVFTVDNITPKLTADIGDTILGMNDGPKYEHKKALLKIAFPRADLPRYRRIVIEEAHKLLGTIGVGRDFDVSRYALRVPAAAMARYLGVGALLTDKVIAWTHALFTDIFVNPTDDPALGAAAQAARTEAVAAIDTIIAARKRELANGPAPEEPSVLDRYLQMQAVPDTFESDQEIRNGLLGLLMGCCDLSGGGIVNALVELLKRPRALREAARAAQQEDDAGIDAYVLEALRFRPPAIGVTSKSVRDYTVGLGTHHAATIPADTLVMACSLSAMHDPEHIEAPEEFRPGRAWGRNYLIWEAGIHTCHGKYYAAMHISLGIKELLRTGLPSAVDPLPRDLGYPAAFRVRLAANGTS